MQPMNQIRHSAPGIVLRGAAAIFVLATMLRIWVGPFPTLPAAYGQIPDAGLQRKLILEETIRTNQLLSDIKAILAERTLNVRIQGADNSSR